MFYVMLIGSATTGVPIWVMFSVACAAMVAIAPLCTYVLCADGLRTSRCTAVGAALVLAASAQLANTFYLQSLGTLCVAAIGPLALALSLLACREFHLRITVLLAIVCGGMLFNYYPGAAVIMVLLASVVVTAVVASHITIKQALVLTCSVVAILLIVSVPYLGNIIRSLSFEMAGNMLIERSASEIQQTFALALTERVIPFLWGFQPLTSSISGLLGLTFPITFSLGVVFTLIMGLSLYYADWPTRTLFSSSLLTYILTVIFYSFRGVGYGVFKLIAWGQPFLLVAAVGCCVSMYTKLSPRTTWLSQVPLMLMAILFLTNLQLTLWLGAGAIGSGLGSVLHNIPGFHMDDFQKMEGLPGNVPIVSAAGDPVVNRW